MKKCSGEEDMLKGSNITKEVDITIRNKLLKEKRDVNVYHHSDRSAHIISCNSSLTSGIKPGTENDYLHISVVSGPGHLKNDCVLDFPSFMDLRFSSAGDFDFVHSGERVLLRIPPGPPTWQIKMTFSTRLSSFGLLTREHVIISDGGEWAGDSSEEV